jgi:hypothetical protein
MDEGRKKTLWVCAAILAAPRLAALEDGKSDALQVEITRDAICKASPKANLGQPPRQVFVIQSGRSESGVGTSKTSD